LTFKASKKMPEIAMNWRKISISKFESILFCGAIFATLNVVRATAQEIRAVPNSHVNQANSQMNKSADQSGLATGEFPDSPGVTLSNSKLEILRAGLGQSLGKGNSPNYLAQETTVKNVEDGSRDPDRLDNNGESAEAGSSSAAAAEAGHTVSTSPQSPVGTAAAGVNHVSGVAAAEPTGVAIATGKQRRVRTIVLRVGAMVGAAVAVGSVVALSEATPSKPPGAH
jgi:hypothetical protein